MAEKFADIKELRGLSEADIQQQMGKLKEELWQQRIKAREGALQQTHRMLYIRRQIARISMVLNERQRSKAAA